MKYMIDIDELIDEEAERIGEDIRHAYDTIKSENPSRFSDEYVLLQFMDKVFDSDTFSDICTELAREDLERKKRDASEALYEACKENCADVARNVGSIPWPACRTNVAAEEKG